jgi:hypothetical protein
VSLCSPTSFETVPATVDSDTVCTPLSFGFAVAIRASVVQAYNGDVWTAISTLQTMINTTSPDATHQKDAADVTVAPFLAAAQQLVANFRSGFDITGARYNMVNSSLRWDATNGPRTQVLSTSHLLTSYATVLSNLERGAAFDQLESAVQSAVTDIESNVDSRLAVINRDVNRNTATLNEMKIEQGMILTSVQVSADAQLGLHFKVNLVPSRPFPLTD